MLLERDEQSIAALGQVMSVAPILGR